MTGPVRPPCPAAVSEVAATVATGPFRAETTTAVVRFTSLLTSFPQLTGIESARCGRMKNFTPPRPLHSSKHPSRSLRDPAIGRVMARRQTCHDVQRDHNQTKSHRRGDTAGASTSTNANLHTTGKGLAVRSRHQPTQRLEPPSARAAVDEPDNQLVTIDKDKLGDLQNSEQPHGSGHSASSRMPAAAEQAHQESREPLDLYQVTAAAAPVARTEGRRW
jgi:hypothetical protein